MSFGLSSKTRFASGIALLAMLAALLFGAPALAADPSAGLSEAEATASSAEVEISEAQATLGPAQASYLAAARRATPVAKRAAAAEAQVEDLTAASSASKVAARGRISQLEAAHDKEVEDHDDDVTGGIASALAALAITAIALGWGWFRASASVAWLSKQGRWQAVGICVGGGIILIILAGAALGAGGIVGALGGFVGFLGMILPVTFLLARHSARVQRGLSKPWLKRERLPGWVTVLLAAVFGVLALASLGTAVFAAGPDASQVTAQMRDEASGVLKEAESQRLDEAEAKATKLADAAADLEDERLAARKPLIEARDNLHQAEHQLTRAEGDVRYYSHRVAVVLARESRKAEKEEALLAEAAEEEAAEECNPNYSGCLDPTASDYDCEGGSGDGPLYTGTVEVTGYDEYGLDDNGNGIGCEP